MKFHKLTTTVCLYRQFCYWTLFASSKPLARQGVAFHEQKKTMEVIAHAQTTDKQ